MNAVSNTPPEFNQVNAGESDSDTNSDESPEYYQPISSADGDDEDEEFSDQHSNLGDGDRDPSGSSFNRLPNGYARCVENGVSSIRRAFRDDDSRRSAPLTAENTMRVMEAMRGVSFGGVAPDWAGRVPESQWIQQLRTIRQSSATTTSAMHD
nr:suppressor protein SRP40 [Ipomoea batatas]GMD14059.1 suppressor protein SRP40 [Ipomoea batatas]